MRLRKRGDDEPSHADAAAVEPLDRADITTVVHAATLAPSVLNIQPWQFVARHDSIELHRDPRRVLRAVDPYHRALTVSCGAALFNLRLAMTELRRQPKVDLLPEGPRSSMLARVSVAGPVEPTAATNRLYGAISARRTSRLPFTDDPLPPEIVVELEEAAAQEGASFRVLSRETALDVRHLVRQADLAQRSDAELAAEVQRWVGRGPDAVDGIPRDALGPAARHPIGTVRDFAMGAPVAGRPSAEFERTPTLAILLTSDDDAYAWMRAGQALERLWLEATAAGLAVSLLTQPLEVSLLRWLSRPLTAPTPRPSGAGPGGDNPDESGARPFWPQALMRIGAESGVTPPTPRRPLTDVLTFA